MAYNLIQLQDAIKNVPLKDVMEYADGKNPDVPSYLALSELNRRKQLQDSATAFQQTAQQSVKDQIASSLSKPSQFSANPTTPHQQVNPAAAPAQTSPFSQPAQANLTVSPQQVDLTQQQAAAASGGLASLNAPFTRQSFAGGGIVAFDGGGQPSLEEKLQLLQQGKGADIPKYQDPLSERLQRFVPQVPDSQFENEGANAYVSAPVMQEPSTTAVSPTSVPSNPNVQASATTSGQLHKPPVFNKPAFTPSSQVSDEELFARHKRLQELAGVSADPYAKVNERYAAIEARQKEQAAQDPWDRLVAQSAAFATAAPEKGFGFQMAKSAEASQALKAQQELLRDKQGMMMADIYKDQAKEEDARRRGDVKGVEEARAAQEKSKMDWFRAESERITSNAHAASVGKAPAEIQLIERLGKDPVFAEAYEKMVGIKGSGALIKDAQSKWDSSLALRMEWEKKGGYPAYLSSQGISMPGAGASAPSGGNIPKGWSVQQNP